MKYLLLMMVFAFGGLLVFGYAEGEDTVANIYVPEFTWEEIRAIYQRRTTLEAHSRSMQRFHACLEGVKRDLGRGKITLAAATTAVCQAGDREGRSFHCALHSSEAPLPKREQVALLLLRHLREEMPPGEGPLGRESVLDGLRCELGSWPGINPATLEALVAEETEFAESLMDNASAR